MSQNPPPFAVSSHVCPDWSAHQFEEVYYGHQCSECGLFFAFGCAPWDDPVESDDGEFGDLNGLWDEFWDLIDDEEDLYW